MSGDARRLVHDQDVVVLVDDHQAGHGLWPRLHRHRRRQRDIQPLPGGYPVRFGRGRPLTSTDP